MRAEKKLDKCDEDCKYSSSGICAFGIRNNIGCYLDDDVKMIAANIIIDAKVHNTKEAIQMLVNLSSIYKVK